MANTKNTIRIVSAYNGRNISKLFDEHNNVKRNLKSQSEIKNNIATILSYCGGGGVAASTLLIIKTLGFERALGKIEDICDTLATAQGYIAGGYCDLVEIELTFNYFYEYKLGEGYFPAEARILKVHKKTGWEVL